MPVRVLQYADAIDVKWERNSAKVIVRGLSVDLEQRRKLALLVEILAKDNPSSKAADGWWTRKEGASRR